MVLVISMPGSRTKQTYHYMIEKGKNSPFLFLKKFVKDFTKNLDEVAPKIVNFFTKNLDEFRLKNIFLDFF